MRPSAKRPEVALMKLAFAAEMREIDRTAIEDVGMPGVALMENAGKGATDALLYAIEGVADRIAIVCGAGNNGGDGYVIARHLIGRDYDVEVFLLANPERIKGDAAINLRIIQAMEVPITRLDSDALDDDAFHAALREIMVADFDVWVDAMLGTGLSAMCVAAMPSSSRS